MIIMCIGERKVTPKYYYLNALANMNDTIIILTKINIK